MDLKNLKTFLYTAELSSFTRAAELLGYSQPTVSFQIRQLEKELNAQLFERINHTVVLTARGREVMQYAQQIIKLSEELYQSLHTPEEITGLVRLATADSLCPLLLGTKFSAFRASYPGIHLKIITAGTEEMFRLLDHNEVDLVLTLDKHIYHAEYIIAHEEKIPMYFVAGAAHPLLSKETLSITDLLTHPFLLETGNADQICQLVTENLGISFLPEYTVRQALQKKQLQCLPVTDFTADIWKQLLYHRDKWLSPAMQVVIDYCRNL